MKFLATPLPGLFVVEAEQARDDRGSFTRTFCAEEFRAHGLEVSFVQASFSYNLHRGTLRGMHYQAEPFGEAKLVSCVRGEIHDVAVDLRPGSATFGRSYSVRLDAWSMRALYIPKGFAHGFQTLADDTVVSYHITAPYRPEAARGVRYDDPALGIAWPLPAHAVSPRDRSLPPLAECRS
jgi:dTDP-4-dehydrorhamnose 3,5-epimerase